MGAMHLLLANFIAREYITVIHLVKNFLQMLFPRIIHNKPSLSGTVLYHIHHQRIIEIRYRDTVLAILISNGISLFLQ